MGAIRGILAGVIVGAIRVTVAIAQCVTPEGSVKPEAAVAKEIDSYLNSLVAENKLSGAVLVAKDGVTVVSKVAGVANKTTGAAITLSTKFNLGSLNPDECGSSGDNACDHGNPAADSGQVIFQETVRRGLTQLRPLPGGLFRPCS